MEKTVEIFDISYEGAGVGKLDGQVVFVPKTLPGENVKIEVVKNSGTYLQARATEILKPSEERTPAVCPYFDICGGCDLQHCSREFEQKCKKEILRKELGKVGFEGDISFVESAKRFSYRNKIKLEVKNGKVGYFKAKSHDFFEVKFCPIAEPEINSAITKVAGFLEKNPQHGLKNVYVKAHGKYIGICFLFDVKCKKMLKFDEKLSVFDDFLVFYAYGNILESDKTEVFKVYGKGDFSMAAFNQVNDEVAKLLYAYVVEKTSGKRVVNAYSGQGLLTSQIAEKADFVYGIELQKSAHLAAQRIATANIKNICGAVENELGRIVANDCIDTIVLDPAREGCRMPALEAILDSGAKQVVYVSCNFATLARDLRVLKQKYVIEDVTIFDMFPCTADMETVVTLRLG